MAASKLRLLQFDDEINMIAGTHGGEKPELRYPYAGDRFVLRHEMIHDNLLFQTEFGSIQRLFKVASLQTDKAALKTCFEEWWKLLLVNSQLTHEVAATYLSIKSYPPQLHSELLVRHPDHYKRYYNTLADLIDRMFTSTYVQYIVGKIIVEIAMQPGLVLRLQNWTPDIRTAIDLQEHEKPDRRLKDLLRILPARLDELELVLQNDFNSKMLGLGLPTRFDYQLEADWLSLIPQQSRALDSHINDVLREWMNPLARTLWPSLNDWKQPCELFVQRLRIWL